MRRASPRSSASARVIVPPNAGVGSAVGFLAAPIVLRAGAQPPHAARRFRCRRRLRRCSPEMAQRCARAGRAGRARRAGHRAPRSPSCAMSGRATRSRSPLPQRATDGGRRRRRCARPSSATMRRCSSARSRVPRSRSLSWSVLVSTEAHAAGAHGAGAAQARAARRPAAARSSTAARAVRSRCRSIAASAWRRARACRARRDRRGRDLDLRLGQF